jgi:hypothetical protein
MNIQVILNSLANTNLSWLSIGMSLDFSIRNYSNAVSGLMGNYDGNANNDIAYKNGTILTNINGDSINYDASKTCKFIYLFFFLFIF